MAAAELGQTRDPRALISGDPAALHAHATALTNRGNTMLNIGEGLRRIDTQEGWSGDAADAFRTKFTPYPTQWLTAGDAHHDAASAISRYADTLEWAQNQAGTAAQQWDQAETTTYAAVTRYNQAAAQGAPLAPFVDPGAADRENAQATLDRARSQLADAGDDAARTISTVTQAASTSAPPSPPPTPSAATATAAAGLFGFGALEEGVEGGLLALAGAGGEVVGGLADVAGGAGIPLNIVSGIGIATGIGMIGLAMGWGKKTSNVNQIANNEGVSPADVKKAIHGVKGQGGWRGDGNNKNPDVEVDGDGEVYPKGSDDSIGNIKDYLPPQGGKK